MNLRAFSPLLTAVGVVVAIVFGFEELRHGGDTLVGAALVAGAVLVAGARIRGGLLGEFGALYWLVLLGLGAWGVTEFRRGGAAVAGGGLISAALLVAFQKPKDESE